MQPDRSVQGAPGVSWAPRPPMRGAGDAGADHAGPGHREPVPGTAAQPGRRRVRWVVAAAAAALVVPVAAVLAATPAWATAASSTIDSPPSGTTYTSPSTINITATVRRQANSVVSPDSGAPVSLVLKSPTGQEQTLATTQNSSQTSLSGWISTNCDDESACQGSPTPVEPAPNGTWTVLLTGDNADASSTFVLEVPPAPPADVAAAASGPESILLTWAPNPDPDLTGYNVLTGSGQSVASGLAPSQVCPSGGGQCSYTVTYPAAQAAGTHSFVLQDSRSSGTSNPPQLTSGDSQEVSATLSGPSSPSQPPAGGGQGSTGSAGSTGSGSSGGTRRGSASTGSSGATGGGSSPFVPSSSASPNTARERAQLSQGLSTFAPSLGVLALPQLASAGGSSASSGPAPGTTEPTQQGTYSPYLGYRDPAIVQTTVKKIPGAQRYVLVGDGAAAHLWRLGAAALVIILSVVQLRLWTRRRAASG